MAKTLEDGIFDNFGRLAERKGITRAEVIKEFQQAFDQIGGTPRLSIWADMNPTEFYRLYGRLLPQSNSDELDGPQEIIVRHVLGEPNMAWQRAIDITDAARGLEALPSIRSDSAAEDSRTHIPTQRPVSSISPSAPKVGADGGAPQEREDRRNGERHNQQNNEVHRRPSPPSGPAGKVRVHRPVLQPSEGNRVGVREDVQQGAARKAPKRR